jgi:signal transduction histidine kinase
MKDTRSPDPLPGAALLKRGAAADAHTRKPLRVLHVEDSDDDTALIMRQLRRDGFLPECKRVDTLDAARAALVEQPWDILLCDYNLPGFDARDALALVHEMNLDIPFIIVSGTIGEEVAIDCVHAGARDFILKDRLVRLSHAVQRELAEVAQRTEKARLNEQLRRAEEALVQSQKLRALGQMAAGIAHDLKNLLNPLYVRLQLLDRQVMRDNSDAAQENIQEMRDILRTGVQTIERLQSFSRQTPEAKSESVDLNQVGHEAIEIARPRMASNRGTLCFLVEEFGTPPPILGNRSELVSALVNLVVNAIDAMPGGGTIKLRTGTDLGGATVQVIDDGPGMTEEVEKRVFEPFFSTKGERGLGLGLAMVYSTVVRHSGTISLATALGKGTTFSLWFPATS